MKRPSSILAAVALLALALTTGPAQADPVPQPVGELLPPTNLTYDYNGTTHAIHLEWKAPLDAGNQTIAYNVYYNGVLNATVSVDLYNGTVDVDAAPLGMSAYYVTAFYPQTGQESTASNPVLVHAILGCLPFTVVIDTHFPFIFFAYDPGCVPNVGPDQPVRFTVHHR